MSNGIQHACRVEYSGAGPDDTWRSLPCDTEHERAAAAARVRVSIRRRLESS